MRNPGCTRRLLACRPGWLGPSAVGVRGYQPGFVGEHDGMDPVAQAELGQQMGHVRLHRRLADRQRRGEL